MTRQEAAEKVAKLRRLARGTSNPHEATAARTQADKLSLEHHLVDTDLLAGRMAAAFDELAELLDGTVARHPALKVGSTGARSAVHEAITTIKQIRDQDKATRLRQIATIVRGAHLLVGDHPLVSGVKSALDTVLKHHELDL